MKEKFRYRSRLFRTAAVVYLIVCFAASFLFLFLSSLADVTYAEAGIVIYFTAIIGMTVIWLLQYSMPSSFKADGNAVVFRLLFKNINIRYSDIISITVTREYAKPQIRGDVGGYREIIKFVCKSGEYRFENIMDIDLEQTAADPESLTEQFERGRFMRLKNYISKQTGITY